MYIQTFFAKTLIYVKKYFQKHQRNLIYMSERQDF